METSPEIKQPLLERRGRLPVPPAPQSLVAKPTSAPPSRKRTVTQTGSPACRRALILVSYPGGRDVLISPSVLPMRTVTLFKVVIP